MKIQISSFGSLGCCRISRSRPGRSSVDLLICSLSFFDNWQGDVLETRCLVLQLEVPLLSRILILDNPVESCISPEWRWREQLQTQSALHPECHHGERDQRGHE